MDTQDKKINISFDNIENNPEFKLVTIEGYVDSYNSKHFQDTILNFIKEGNRNLILNCQGLSYLSSAGIGSFVAITEELKENGILVLYKVHPKVLEVFALLGFTEIFNICETFEEALQKAQELLSQKEQPILSEQLEEKIIFPFIFECKVCGKKLKASKPGKYNCPQCHSSIKIDPDGSISYP